jgi:very-short-patch-repair endonuclease
MLAIEYDGRWHDSPEQRVLDEARRGELAARGWTVVVIRADDLYENPDGTLSSLQCTLRAHGIPCPAVLAEEWRRHFSTPALSA